MPQPNKSSNTWYALDVLIETAAREAVEYGLMEAGALGTETENTDEPLLSVTAYFDAAPDHDRVRDEIVEALRIYELPASSLRDMKSREVADQDWLGEWKKTWQPTVVGNFIIAPPWTEVSSNRIVIRIEPGMAFGTGTHETTRLCLKAIEKYFRGGSLLDVGTGTGILAIAAAKLFPAAKIEACDTDADAVEIAKENAQLNETPQVMFRVGSIGAEVTASADLVCANLTADVISDLLPALIAATCGRLILCGILDSQLDLILERLRECDAAGNCVIMQDGEWVAVVV
jgi:ribosomal protein L11 methyltransferase